MAQFLCICQYGHSRSVALARLLHGLGHEAVAIGHATAPSSLPALGAWAKWVLVVDKGAWGRVRQCGLDAKAFDFDIGPDRWQNPYSPEMKNLFMGLMGQHFPNLKTGAAL